LESRTKLQHVRQAARPTCGLPQRSAQLHDCCTPAPRVCPAGAKQCTSACPRMDIAARRQQRQLQPQQLRCVKAGPQARAPAGQPRSGRQQTAAAPALSARTPRGTAWSVARGCARPAAPAGPRRPARAALARLRWRTMHRCRAPPPPAPWRRARAAPACRAAAAAPRSWAARSCCARAAGTGRGSAPRGALRPRPARSVRLFAVSLPGARPLAYLLTTARPTTDMAGSVAADVNRTFLAPSASCQASSLRKNSGCACTSSPSTVSRAA
jgi:hypothetical protein